MASVKKSRACLTGVVTRTLDKLKAIKSDEPAEIRLINSKDIDRVLSSLTKRETNFLQSMEDAQNFVPEDDGEEDFLLEEQLAIEAFESAMSKARDLADQLLALKSILNGLSDFTLDLTALQESLGENPESNQSTSLQELKTSYSALREEWKRANLPNEHSVKAELDSCKKAITTLGAEVASALAKSDTHSVASSTSTSSTDRICCGNSKSDLPTIDVLSWKYSRVEHFLGLIQIVHRQQEGAHQYSETSVPQTSSQGP